jgi:hypothetical protein
VDFLILWPYDQGGCCCARCAPYGGNGFVRIGEQIAQLARELFPEVQIILSTWLFDAGVNQNEWATLATRFAARPAWVQYIMADAHNAFPAFPLTHGVPGGLPLLNFPEISMWGMGPWGGYGANPLPARFTKLWAGLREAVAGGIPYSEGIFEDLNKVLWVRWFWDPALSAEEILTQYCTYEIPGADPDALLRALTIMEQNHHHFRLALPWWQRRRDAGSEECYLILRRIAKSLAPAVAGAWRWRILYLRGVIDYGRFHPRALPDPELRSALEELTAIYHASHAQHWVKPPIPPAKRRNRAI